jgi:DNA gyrase subunit A
MTPKDADAELPDVRDGLQSATRALLLSLNSSSSRAQDHYERSISIVRDAARRCGAPNSYRVYDALVGMVQDFTTRYPLIDGQGNFGSIAGDPAAHPRYTEAQLSAIGREMFARPRQDATPSVLAAGIPNLLINGFSAGAVRIPPHNLREVVSALTYLIDHPAVTLSELGEYVKGPDFPTGACVYRQSGIKAYQETGRGQIVLRGTFDVETHWGGSTTQLVFCGIPYGVDAATLITRIAELARANMLSGISDLRDESDRSALRIVVGIKRKATAEDVLRQLFELTPMQSTIDVNMMALAPDPRGGSLTATSLSLKDLLVHYIGHRESAVLQQAQVDLEEALARRQSGGDDRDADAIARLRGLTVSRPARLQFLKDELRRISKNYGDARRTQIGDGLRETP